VRCCETVGELDHEHAQVVGHGHDHLSEVLGCPPARGEGELADLVTPSTSSAISRPNSRSRSSLVALVSSRTSWRRPAVTVVTSILKFTRRPATSRGWERYGSPEARC